MLKASLDSKEIMRQYGQALRRLAALSGFNQREVLMGEAGIILKTWAGKTKVRTDAKTDMRSRIAALRSLALTTAYEVGDITINAGLRGSKQGLIWRKVRRNANSTNKTGGRGFLAIGQMDPNGKVVDWGIASASRGRNHRRADWSKYASVTTRANQYANVMPQFIARGRAATGLARQSVVQIAEKLGIDLLSVKGGGTLSAAGIAKAKAALATTGRQHQNGTGSVAGSEINTVVTLMNNLPYATKPSLGMDKTLRAILAGRAKFFQQSYAKGAFDTMTSAARAYPWMRVVRPAGA
jgi:hypothetical protein